MRVPLSWLRAYLPGLTAPADDVAAALVRSGLEVEQVHRVGHDVAGVVVAQVLELEELTEYTKPIRFCRVAVSEEGVSARSGDGVRDVVCGATNFAVGDRVPFALPGAELPGGIRIGSRRTYGHLSDGMICSEAELGLAADSAGILVLADDAPLGADVVELLQLRDEVLDIAVTPDRGYALSVRGVARETATALGLPFADPAAVGVPAAGGGYRVRIDDESGCSRYVARTVTGLDPAAVSPLWLRRRLVLAGMRPVSLAVDVTNHVMLGLGQPLHAFDLDALRGEVVVRRARPGERLTTLDGQDRELHPEDLLITDDSGPIALAGVMGGGPTEVGPATTSLLLESATFAPVTVARTARRHRLPSEASRRYERGVDPALADAAAEVAVRMLAELGGAVAGPATDVDRRRPLAPVRFDLQAPARTAGRDYPLDVVRARLRDVGCTLSEEGAEDGEVVQVLPPSWRPDLTGTAELVEEVVRLEGYDSIPVELPSAPAGRGWTVEQRLRRTASRALASAGLVEVALPPFVSPAALDALDASAARDRTRPATAAGDGAAGGAPHGMDAPRLLNPLSEDEALLRPTLLPGLLSAAARNVARGLADVALFETGHVFLGSDAASAPWPGIDERPADDALQALDATLPQQPRHAGLVLTGRRADGLGDRPVGWADAVETVLALARALRLELSVRAAGFGPWHPGRTAELLLDGSRVGLAGELHPRTLAALGVPPRTCAAELNLDALVAAAAGLPPVPAPVVSHFPRAAVDVALVVDASTPAAAVQAALRDGAGPLLEQLRLFDVYSGPQVGAGRRSLAYALRFRAPDRTLTDEEVLAARDAAVAEAARRTGAVLRGGVA